MDKKTEKAIARLPELIENPYDYAELIAVGDNVNPEARNFVIKATFPEGTPTVLWFGEEGLLFYCQSGATVGIEVVAEDFDVLPYFGEHARLYLNNESETGIVRFPFSPFLEGRNGGLIDYPETWVEKAVLIYREIGNKFDGLAAVVVVLNNLVQFGFTAIAETDFTYLFNNQCVQLQEEAQASPRHRVVEIMRKTQRTSFMTNSLLWLVE